MGTAPKKQIPIGYEDFKEVIEKNMYYVDKTLFIEELLNSSAKINLITRPRRFGKTLNLSMLKYFFDISAEDSSHLFDGLKIVEAGSKYTSQMGQFPVISLTLKSVDSFDFDNAFEMFKILIGREYRKHSEILKSDCLDELQKEMFSLLLNQKASFAQYTDSLNFLAECLYKYYGKKVIILIDEYDVPLEKAFHQGYYDKMLSLLRGFLHDALKTTAYCEFAVITGCLRISRESIFTGLNNLKVHSIYTNAFSSRFGFTTDEVDAMLSYYDVQSRTTEFKEWYDGYTFGNESEIYNPWSVINAIFDLHEDSDYFLRPYWSNTSGNDVIRELIHRANDEVQEEIDTLIAGGTITKPIHEDITYDEVYKTQENIWNFLYFTGYLKKVNEQKDGITIFLTMKIPNLEIQYIYEEKIRSWFNDYLKANNTGEVFKSILSEDVPALQTTMNRLLKKTISYNNYKESFYHAFLAGLLVGQEDYSVKSDYESGEGRPDIMIFDDINRCGTGIVIEVKCAKDPKQIQAKLAEGIAQIGTHDYKAFLRDEGSENVTQYVFVFCKKRCVVHKMEE